MKRIATVLCAALAGCSVIYDPSDLMGGGPGSDAGPRDDRAMGPDGAPGADAPRMDAPRMDAPRMDVPRVDSGETCVPSGALPLCDGTEMQPAWTDRTTGLCGTVTERSPEASPGGVWADVALTTDGCRVWMVVPDGLPGDARWFLRVYQVDGDHLVDEATVPVADAAITAIDEVAIGATDAGRIGIVVRGASPDPENVGLWLADWDVTDPAIALTAIRDPTPNGPIDGEVAVASGLLPTCRSFARFYWREEFGMVGGAVQFGSLPVGMHDPGSYDGFRLMGEAAPGTTDVATGGSFAAVAHPSTGFWIWNTNGGPPHRETMPLNVANIAAAEQADGVLLVITRPASGRTLSAIGFRCLPTCDMTTCSNLMCSVAKGAGVIGAVDAAGPIAADALPGEGFALLANSSGATAELRLFDGRSVLRDTSSLPTASGADSILDLALDVLTLQDRTLIGVVVTYGGIGGPWTLPSVVTVPHCPRP